MQRQKEEEEEEDEDEDRHIPDCTNTGDYRTKQCHHEECWCVDTDNNEIENSRQVVDNEVDFQCTGGGEEWGFCFGGGVGVLFWGGRVEKGVCV